MKTILIVAMADSVHTARWLAQFRNQELSVVIFPSGPHRRVHPLIRALLVGDQNMKVIIAPLMKTLSLPLYVVDTFLGFGLRSAYLRHLVNEHRPEVVHALETQHSGYLAVRAISKLKRVPEFRLSLWGSDLVWFSKFKHHRKMIRNVLAKVDRLSIECQRDIEIAKSLGFVGEVLPILPASGGIELSETQTLSHYFLPSKRKKITIKGYSGFVGRAPTALKALEALASQVRDYEIHVYSASVKTIRLARRLEKRTGLRVICHPKHSLSHQEVMSLFQQSRISISISLSDGFPGSLREAMVSGCFPIESLNSCGNEWAIPNESASFVNPLNEEEIVKAIQRALNDDTLVDVAAKTNWELAKSRFSTSSTKRIIDSYYLGQP
jgi:glycosyltransferase involved in cell wall biosynthesis